MENLSSIESLSVESLNLYLNSALRFMKDGKPCLPSALRNRLSGKTIALLFLEPSTRTRASFEIAAKQLGATTILINATNTSIQKGESIRDTCLNLVAMGVDLIVLRQNEKDILYSLCDDIPVPLVNAGNGSDAHPTQALLDTLTLLVALKRGGEIRRRDLSGIHISIIGDLKHSRVAKSDIRAFSKFGAHLTLGGPREGMLKDEKWSNIDTVNTRKDALKNADAVVCLRVQKERIQGPFEGIHAWTIDDKVMQEEMKRGAFILHPGPVIWGEELSAEVSHSTGCLILKQVGYGVAIRQAVLLHLLGMDT